MNRFLLLAAVCVGVLAFEAVPARSQQSNSSPEQALRKLKEENAKLLEAQTATLQKLDDLTKEAQQLRGFAHRS